MARKIYYKIIDDGVAAISDDEWNSISRLQHWYNSEFIWTAGRLALKMFAIFPDTERHTGNIEDLRRTILRRRLQLQEENKSENEIVRTLVSEGLIIAQRGGYFEQCLASGFTRVAGNEFDAYLVCEFLLKISHLCPNITIDIYDEGEFIKTRQIKMMNGEVIIPIRDRQRMWYYEQVVKNRHAFAVVDSGKYDDFPKFQSTINDFNDMTFDERMTILKDWNWLGFENNYDINGDDIQGFDLNKKVTVFRLENLQGTS